MPKYTENLELFKWNTEDEKDLNLQFNLEKSINENFDKIDNAIGELNENKVEQEKGKGLSTNDFTDEDKARLDSLENYDDTEVIALRNQIPSRRGRRREYNLDR